MSRRFSSGRPGSESEGRMARIKWTRIIGTAIFLVACAAVVGVWRLRRGEEKVPA